MGLFSKELPRLAGNPNGVRPAKPDASLTASGFRVKKGDGQVIQQLAQAWQQRSFYYYDNLGEIKYAAQFYSRALSNLRIFPAVKDQHGDIVEVEDDEQQIALIDRIQDPGGGKSGLLASYGRLMFLVGESLLFVSHNPETDTEQWEMLSSDELRIQDGSYLRYRAPSLLAEGYREPNDDDWTPVTDKEAVAYRLWQRHPRYSMLPDATMQGVLDLCEELMILTRAVRARGRSRLAGSGILFLSDEFSKKPLEAVPDEDIEEDPLLTDLKNAMLAPIADEGVASAVVPLLLRGTTQAIKEGVRHLQVVDPTQLYPETGLRYECIKRIAIGLDMPPEILMGLQDSNHWTAWQIDEQTWKSHLQPKAQQLVDDLTSSYYRPMLRELGIKDWADRSIGYDATAIINHPDRTKDAKELYALRAIGKRALREAGGFDEEDAPTNDELAEMVGIAVRDSSLAWYGVPTIRGGQIEPEAGVVENADTPGGVPTESTGADVEPGPAKTPSGDEPDQPTAIVGAADQAAARILGAADLGVARARELAGNRLRSLAKNDAEATELIDGVRASAVAFTLGPERVATLNAPPAIQLVGGARSIVEDALRMQDITGPIAKRIAETIEVWAARTLYEERPGSLPAAFGHFIAEASSNGNGRPLVPA